MAEKLQSLIFQAMSEAAFYPHRVEKLSQLETHISKVFLTGPFVYKIKKPVDLGFVDFRDLERRHFFCRREVELNRRLTENVYLAVVPICYDGCKFQLEGSGRPVENAVKMRQLSADRTMENLLATAMIGQDDLESLATVLADFHEASPRRTNPEARSYLQAACTQNFRQIMPLAGESLDAGRYDYVRAATFNYFIRNKHLLEKRIAAGRFRHAHGDLRAEHIYLMEDGLIQILDCIEFNERLQVMDVASDLAFLIMDLEYRQASQCARELLKAYYRHSDDTGLPGMMDFYKCYRAMVRCKVNCILLSGPDSDQGRRKASLTHARGYLKLAHFYARRFNRPTLWVFCGLPASGKSALASRLAELMAIEVYNSDRIRKNMHGIDPMRQIDGPVDDGIYAPEISTQVYDRLRVEAARSIHAGCSVALDATYASSSHRRKLSRMAAGCGARILFVECRAPDEVMRHRLNQRREGLSVSDARIAHFEILRARFETLDDILPEQHVVLDTRKTADSCLRDLLEAAYLDGIE